MSERSESETPASTAYMVLFAVGTLIFALAAWWWDNAGGWNAAFLGFLGLAIVAWSAIIRRGQL